MLSRAQLKLEAMRRIGVTLPTPQTPEVDTKQTDDETAAAEPNKVKRKRKTVKTATANG